VQELSQASHEYEKLREEHPRIRVAENLVEIGVISTSAILTGLVYHNSIKDVPLNLPTEEEVMDALINGIRYGWVSPSGASGTRIYKPETKEEAIKALIQKEKDARLMGYFIPLCSVSLVTYLHLCGINPGEKILKSSYAVTKTVRDNFSTIKSYLKRMQELKQKRKEERKRSELK
jgi:hypothetical protein